MNQIPEQKLINKVNVQGERIERLEELSDADELHSLYKRIQILDERTKDLELELDNFIDEDSKLKTKFTIAVVIVSMILIFVAIMTSKIAAVITTIVLISLLTYISFIMKND